MDFHFHPPPPLNPYLSTKPIPSSPRVCLPLPIWTRHTNTVQFVDVCLPTPFTHSLQQLTTFAASPPRCPPRHYIALVYSPARSPHQLPISPPPNTPQNHPAHPNPNPPQPPSCHPCSHSLRASHNEHIHLRSTSMYIATQHTCPASTDFPIGVVNVVVA